MSDLDEAPFALALSGGGYRATLFHLGALRRLNEVGLLKRTERIVSVSGGSLLLGFILAKIPEVLKFSEGVSSTSWEEVVSKPIHNFVKNDLRTAQIVRNIFLYSFFGRKKRLDKAISQLDNVFEGALLKDVYFEKENANFPEIYILSTDCLFGQAFRYSNNPHKSGHSKIGWADLTETRLAEACMVSACFPPLFGPYFPNYNASDFKGGLLSENDRLRIPGMALADGGLYDNIGVNLVANSSSDFVRLYSDAGSPISYDEKGWTKSPLVTLRYMQLMSNFVGRLNIQRIKATKKNLYAYWSSQHEVEKSGEDIVSYPASLIENHLEHIRTDLNKFSGFEAKVLENFGYAQVELSLKKHFGEEYAKLRPPAANWPYPEDEFTDAEIISSKI